MKEKKTIYEKLWDMPMYAHFIIWFLVVYIAFGAVFYNVAVNPMRMFIGLAIMAGLLSTGVTCMLWLAKKAQEFYSILEGIEQRAKDATTSDELLIIRKELLKNWRKNSFDQNTGAESKKVLQIIDTRLIYEFKVKFDKPS